MQINIQDRDFLRSKITDFDSFMAQIPDILTEHGGFFAGGLLRRAINKGSFYDVFEQQDLHLFKYINSSWLARGRDDPFSSEHTRFLKGPKPDIDIFYVSQSAYDNTLVWLKNAENCPDITSSRYARTFEIQLILTDPKGKRDTLVIRTKVQLVNSVIDHGIPTKVLQDFDLANCMIAYSPATQYVYYHDAVFSDTLELNSSYTKELYAHRVSKYLNIFDNKISDSTIEQLKIWATEKANEFEAIFKLCKTKKDIASVVRAASFQSFINLVIDPDLKHIFDYKHYLQFAVVPQVFQHVQRVLAKQKLFKEHFGRTIVGDPIVETTSEIIDSIKSWWKKHKTPELDIKVETTYIQPKTRKLTAKWTIEIEPVISENSVRELANALDDQLLEETLNSKEFKNASKTTP